MLGMANIASDSEKISGAGSSVADYDSQHRHHDGMPDVMIGEAATFPAAS